MMITFSTTQKDRAELFLKDPAYNYLPVAAKVYVLENLGDIRVQDPAMHPKANIEFHGAAAKHHYDAVRKLLDSKL